MEVIHILPHVLLLLYTVCIICVRDKQTAGENHRLLAAPVNLAQQVKTAGICGQATLFF